MASSSLEPPEVCNMSRTPSPAEPPPSYQETVRGWKLSYVDFTPKCFSAGGMLSKPQFETYGMLMSRANKWLRENPDLLVRSCETIETSCAAVRDGTDVDTQSAVQRFSGKNRFCFKALRLWIIPRPDGMPTNLVQQVGYMNILPACTDPGGIRFKPTYDSLETTIEKFNKLMDTRPLPGSVLNIETIRVKYCQWTTLPDPEVCYWRVHSYFRTSYIRVIRIYYLVGPGTKEAVGWEDFDPQPLPQTPLHCSGHENIYNILKRARAWISQQTGKRILNVQTLQHKLRGGILKSKDTLYSEAPLLSTWYVKSLRFYYVYPHPSLRNVNYLQTKDLFSNFYCKMFFPTENRPTESVSGDSDDTANDPENHESMSAIMKDVNRWLDYNTEVWLVGVETLQSQWTGRRSFLQQAQPNFLVNGVRLYTARFWPERARIEDCFGGPECSDSISGRRHHSTTDFSHMFKSSNTSSDQDDDNSTPKPVPSMSAGKATCRATGHVIEGSDSLPRSIRSRPPSSIHSELSISEPSRQCDQKPDYKDCKARPGSQGSHTLLTDTGASEKEPETSKPLDTTETIDQESNPSR